MRDDSQWDSIEAHAVANVALRRQGVDQFQELVEAEKRAGSLERSGGPARCQLWQSRSDDE